MPVAVSHILAVWSRLPVRMRVPSRFKNSNRQLLSLQKVPHDSGVSPTLARRRSAPGMSSCDFPQSPGADYESRVEWVYFQASRGRSASSRPGVRPNESADKMSHLRSLALQIQPGWPMPSLRHRRYVADRPVAAHTLPTEAEDPPQIRRAQRHASGTSGAPGKVIGNFLQSNSEDYESNS